MITQMKHFILKLFMIIKKNINKIIIQTSLIK